MELIGAIVLSYGIVILWDYNTTLLWVIAGPALLALAAGLASFFELQKKAPKVLKSLRRAQKRTPRAEPSIGRSASGA
jgi:ABC-type bacteriocin/lantibiotic exporter with double-glycine peptidase domain